MIPSFRKMEKWQLILILIVLLIGILLFRHFVEAPVDDQPREVLEQP